MMAILHLIYGVILLLALAVIGAWGLWGLWQFVQMKIEVEKDWWAEREQSEKWGEYLRKKTDLSSVAKAMEDAPGSDGRRSTGQNASGCVRHSTKPPYRDDPANILQEKTEGAEGRPSFARPMEGK